MRAFYPGYELSECLALFVIRTVSEELDGSAADQQILPALWEEYDRLHETRPPAEARRSMKERPSAGLRNSIR
jgi:hypothetical protein